MEFKDQIARDIQSTIDETDGEIKIERDNDSHLRRLPIQMILRQRVLSPFEKCGDIFVLR